MIANTQLIFKYSKEGRKGFRVAKCTVNECALEVNIPSKLLRKNKPNLPEVTEFQVVRHYTNLSSKNHHLDKDFYPLGSCTMKYNPKINDAMALLPGFAQIHPNPNSLGKAYLDDFESSKRSTFIPITYGSWKKSSPPGEEIIENSDTIYNQLSIHNRKDFSWYNPYDEVQTQDIWPNIEVSSTANNQTTKTLSLETDTTYYSNVNEMYWSGISVPLYTSDYNQTNNNQYLNTS